MSAYGTMLEEARADRYHELLAERAVNVALGQAWLWHRTRHKRCFFDRTDCQAYRLVKEALCQGVADMTLEQQREYVATWG